MGNETYAKTHTSGDILPGRVPGTPEAATPPLAGKDGARQLRVLIVDDEPMIRELLREIVAPSAAHIDAADSFARARRLLSHGDYDWALLDNDLGDGNGLDLLRTIHRHAPGTRVAMITADACHPDFIQEATENGAERVIGKPFGPQEVVDLISQPLPPRRENI